MVSSRMAVLMMAVLMIGVATRIAEAQSPTPECASKLVGCAEALNSTTPPPSTCCDPLREAVTNELDCLCNLYANPTLFRQLGINVTKALLLPQRCNIPGDISACRASSPGGSPSTPGSTTPATPRPGNGVGKIASSGLSSLLLIWASQMLF
ncbi:hypothetical protein M9H77_32834 [Catharanthus roseus]|uniref:Uncharacterized protein n=1 Tax=Catharanthus roseus TaxID=4058 RepID=A0ACC0A420_CATRO|nr:hypothetical protein M9H77_32834 [Catharanthus roseus]